ncbi:MAG: DUF4912 domain-containing protein [Treponema sp.]|nr:DUF4912 domain-containing protein [Treponema sp.]
MKKDLLTRQRLEAMSTADLLSLADDYGIDFPDNLDRRLIIGELLEFTEEDAAGTGTDETLTEQELFEEQDLPLTYNDTTVSLFMRNPAWLFVYWDIKESDMAVIKQDPSFESIFLHITFYENETDEKPCDSFDLSIKPEQRELSVLIPTDKKYVMVSLAQKFADEQPRVLTFSKKMKILKEREDIRDMQPGKKIKMSPLVELSGMKELLYSHYINHRQSFSN